VRYLAVFGVIPRDVVLRNLNAPRACIPEDAVFAIWGKNATLVTLLFPFWLVFLLFIIM
jgi:hypothetical protein